VRGGHYNTLGGIVLLDSTSHTDDSFKKKYDHVIAIEVPISRYRMIANMARIEGVSISGVIRNITEKNYTGVYGKQR
jgi:hypothetical protein